MTKPVTFKQADVTRAVNGVASAGLPVARVRVSPDGAIEIIVAGESDPEEQDNPLDRHVHGKKAA